MALPRRKRDALSAVYAFMRHADDISDGPELSLQEKRIKLDAWLEAAKEVFEGKPTDDPVLMALADSQKRFKIPVESENRLASGQIWTHPVVANGCLYLRDQELLYCYDVKDHALKGH